MTVAACPPPTAPTRGIVVFSAAEFKTAYPEFTTLSTGVLQADFDVATLFLNNSCCSVVVDANLRQRLLYLLTAHIAALLQGVNGQPPSGLIGRVDQATEGSVSVSASYTEKMSMSEAYFAQTQYGILFWQATASYRGFRYVPPANLCIGPPWGNSGGCR